MSRPLSRLTPFLFLFGAPALLYGQFAQIAGIVTDSSSAVVSGAVIRVTATSTGVVGTVRSDQSGAYGIPFLRPGTYDISAEGDGFRPVRQLGIVLETGQNYRLNFTMIPGAATESITVTEATSYINTESGAVQTVIDSRLVRNLPLNGRSFQTLLQLTPGALPAREAGQFSVNGQRANANYFTIDGVSANVGVNSGQVPGQGGAGSLPALSVQGTSNNLMSVDSLEEFSVNTSTYAPEFGRTPGGQVSLVTRAGTSAVHGSLFEYFRNDKLDANDFFANRNGLARPPLRQNQFGGTLGGPVGAPGLGVIPRTFFFASYEGLRLREPKVTDVVVPSLAARNSAPAAVKPFLDAYPLPNGPELTGSIARYAASYSQPSEANAFALRLDHAVTERMRVFGRFSTSPSNQVQRKAAVLSNLQTSSLDTNSLTLGATNTVASSLVNDLRYNRTASEGSKVDSFDTFGGARPATVAELFPAGFADPNGYLIANSGNGVGGLSLGPDGRNRSTQQNIVDHLSWINGSHTFKFGADYRHIASGFNVGAPDQYRPTYNFGNVPQALNSRLNSAILNVKQAVRLNFTNLSLYAQDTWRATRRLTLTYGLRWEYNPAPRAASEAEQPFTIRYDGNLSGIALAPQGSDLYQTTTTNFAPRVGGAYRLSDRTGWETVIRGGYGLFFDMGTGVIANATGAFPFLRTKRLPANTVFPITVDQATPISASAPPPYDLLRAFDPNIVLPRVHQFSGTIEQGLGEGQVLSIAYVGARGRQLLRQESISNPSSLTALLQLTTNGDRSDYDALQVQFNRRFTRGLRILSSYTFGKSLDTSSTDAGFLPRSDRLPSNNDRGPSDFDIRHSFSAAVSYDLPGRYENRLASAVLQGWGLDVIAYLRSAPPFSVTGIRTFSFGSVSSARPHLVQGVPLFIEDANAPGGRRVNNTRVSPNQVGPFLYTPEIIQGSMGRNTLRGFDFKQADIAVRRNFRLSEGVSLQARLEMFNAFNHANFSLPNSGLGTIAANGTIPDSANFGLVTSSLNNGLSGLSSLYQIGGPRSMQVSLRLGF